MLVFNGGLTIEQVEKLKNNNPIIYDKIPYEQAYANGRNTFDYAPKKLYGESLDIFKKYISEDCYSNQYIFLARYLSATFEFCNNHHKKNYIMVCDVDENILNDYIGVGDYCDGDYRIEYRVPRKFITPEKIKEFLFFEPYNTKQIMELYEKYKDYYAVKPEERETAKKLIYDKKLQFNEEKIWN